MVETFWYFVLVPMVYISILWSIVWIIINVVRVIRTPNSPKAHRIFPEGKTPDDPPEGAWSGAIFDAFTLPTIRKLQPTLWFFIMLFHIFFVLLIIVHLDLLPQINITSQKSQGTLGYGFIGLVFTISLIYLFFRRFKTPVREVSVPADYIILFLLICLAISGDIISWGNSWTDTGFVLTKQEFGIYLDNLLKFRFVDPKETLAGGHYPVIGTHVLFANLFFFVLPFSKVMHFCFAVPLNKLRRG
jgi:nitrate reductase gamma subunit